MVAQRHTRLFLDHVPPYARLTLRLIKNSLTAPQPPLILDTLNLAKRIAALTVVLICMIL